MEEIILFTTHCPKCKILETKLKQKNIEYSECDDIEKITSFGISSAPVLKIGNDILNFNKAIQWINKRG